MTDLSLDDRTYEHTDGTWISMKFRYHHPWEVDGRPEVYVRIDSFERKGDRSFDFKNPDSTTTFHLDEMATVMLHGFLGAAKDLMVSQWAEYLRGEKQLSEPLP